MVNMICQSNEIYSTFKVETGEVTPVALVTVMVRDLLWAQLKAL